MSNLTSPIRVYTEVHGGFSVNIHFCFFPKEMRVKIDFVKQQVGFEPGTLGPQSNALITRS